MMKIIQQTKLSRDICHQVWELVNPQGEETFSKPQFLMTMHLLAKAKNGVKLPNELPSELISTSSDSQMVLVPK
jgi:hypothetical protein